MPFSCAKKAYFGLLIGKFPILLRQPQAGTRRWSEGLDKTRRRRHWGKQVDRASRELAPERFGVFPLPLRGRKAPSPFAPRSSQEGFLVHPTFRVRPAQPQAARLESVALEIGG